ncbi:hypothetical protein AGATL06_29750 [Agathobaculum sp. TL06]
MSFSDHKITQFTHKITDLPDQPSLPANELKARFDSSPEELRQAVNGICDDASRLEARVEGIVVDTFGDTIDREMLSDELAAELDAKITQADLAAETAAREAADSALGSRIESANTTAASKCQLYIGTYTGTGSYPRTVYTGFTPRAVIVSPQAAMDYGEYGTGGAVITQDGSDSRFSRIISGGFELRATNNPNAEGIAFYYLAFR